MNTPSRRKFGNQLGFAIIAAGVFGLIELTGGSLSLTQAASSQPAMNYSRINRALPGAKSGQLKTVKDTTAVIDNISYPFAPGVVIETQFGQPLPLSQGVWQQQLHYPIAVQYWVGSGQITQIIIILPQ
jgi:hypothetical protein